MKFAVRAAAVLAVIMLIGLPGLSPRPAQASGVRVFHLPPGETPVMGDPDGGNGFASQRIPVSGSASPVRKLAMLQVQFAAGRLWLFPDSGLFLSGRLHSR